MKRKQCKDCRSRTYYWVMWFKDGKEVVQCNECIYYEHREMVKKYGQPVIPYRLISEF